MPVQAICATTERQIQHTDCMKVSTQHREQVKTTSAPVLKMSYLIYSPYISYQ